MDRDLAADADWLDLRWLFALGTHQHENQVRADIERDKVLTAAEAKQYGIVDDIIPS